MLNEAQLRDFRDKERLVETRNFLFIASSVLTAPLVLLFWLSDIAYAPEQKWRLLAIRSLTIPLSLITNFGTRRFATSLTRAQCVATFLVAGNSAIITAIIYKTGGELSPHYFGLNLACMAGSVVFAWTRPFLFLNIALLYVPYLLLCFFAGSLSQTWGPFCLNLFFIGGTLVVTLVLRDFAEHLRGRELRSRLQLREELKARARIIEEKTQEAIRLSSLTKQFSPQVVHAIQSGKLDILKSPHSSPICALFIDIVESTDLVTQSPWSELQQVLSLFMEDTMKVLLKYDITIDKFLGDGVLGFSNDPISRADYVERVLDAALEVRARIRLHQGDYSSHWKVPFQIRIGIASGDASVGFYGSDDFKSYTALGKVMNLASRICGAAAPGQILVSEEVGRALPENSYDLALAKLPPLKGFSVSRDAFEVKASRRESSPISEINMCPKGHGVLHLDASVAGTPVFACRTCGHCVSVTFAKAS